MTQTFRAGLLATAMAAAVLVPAAGVVTVASMDAAYAKGEGNGNGGGGGERGNNGGGERGNGSGGRASEAHGGGEASRGGGRPEWAGDRSNGVRAGQSESARGGSDPISNFIRGLTGQDKRDARAQARDAPRSARQATTERAPRVSIAPASRPDRTSDLHASDLGNMNGALNADMNAVLAHIRNGNTNGPIGQMAALAVTSAAAAEAGSSLSAADVQAYREFEIRVDEVGFEAAREEFPQFEETTYQEYLAAKDAEADLLSAQESILAYWNRNPDAAPEIDDELERPLLDALMSRFDGYETEIEQAVSEAEARAATEVEPEDVAAACEAVVGCEAPETLEQDLAIAD